MASVLLCLFLPKPSHPLPCFSFLSPSATPRRGRHSGERRGSGPRLLSLMLSPPTLQPPGFHRAYSSPLYSDQQYACVKDLCK